MSAVRQPTINVGKSWFVNGSIPRIVGRTPRTRQELGLLLLFSRIGWRVDAMWDRIVVFLAFLAHRIDAARLTPRANTVGPSQHALRADNADWMAEDASVLRDMTLGEVVLPGTHDAGAYALTSKLMPGSRFPTPWEAAAIAIAEDLGIGVDRVITPWALTQSLDVLAQLEFGYRYIDLRAGWNGTAWCAHHAEIGVPIADVLNDIATFMLEHPGEVVVMQTSHLDGFPDATRVDELLAMVTKTLGEFMAGPEWARDKAFGDVGIGEMVDSGRRLAVVFGDGDYESVGGGGGASKTTWPPEVLHNAYADADDPTAVMKYVRGKIVEYNNSSGELPGTMSKISWTLTAQTKTVIGMFEPGTRPRSLRELTERSRPAFGALAEEMVQSGCRAGNIMSVDFGGGAGDYAVWAARAMNHMPRDASCSLKNQELIAVT